MKAKLQGEGSVRFALKPQMLCGHGTSSLFRISERFRPPESY